jgi:hypothetical protein
MLHKEFFGLIFLGFVFWIIAATSPTQRIENACRPVGWSGNVITSMSALVLPNQQTVVQGWFDKIEYGCRYTTWRLFYQEDYNKWKAIEAAKQKSLPPLVGQTTPVEGGSAAPPATSPPPPGAAPEPNAESTPKPAEPAAATPGAVDPANPAK